MKILALSGSLRANSYNTAIVKTLQKLNSDVNVYEDLGTLPLFNPDLDIHSLEEDNSPKQVVDFRAKVREADVFIISTPEYAHQISGVLKNALDWLVSSDAIVAKPTVVISASTSAMGGDKAHAQLVALLKVISQNVLEKASLLVPRINKKIDEEGVITDEVLEKELIVLLNRVEAFQKLEEKLFELIFVDQEGRDLKPTKAQITKMMALCQKRGCPSYYKLQHASGLGEEYVFKNINMYSDDGKKMRRFESGLE